jgi:CRISPR-associated exonuclease Cas4
MRFEIAISFIRQYLFCPRAAWHRCWLHQKVPNQAWMDRGNRFHKKQIRNYQRRRGQETNGRVLHFEEMVSSKSDGFYGVSDLIVEYRDSLDIIEFKMEKGLWKAALMQVGAYAFAAQDAYNKEVRELFIFNGANSKPSVFTFDSVLSNEVKDSMKRTRECLESEILPFADPPISKCGQCEFLRFCNDRL